MNCKTSRSHASALMLVFAVATGLGAIAAPAAAQAQAQAQRTSTAGFLDIGEIERRVKAQGIEVTEIELKTRLAEVEGYDNQSRKVKLVIDRRTGEVLERKVKVRYQQN